MIATFAKSLAGAACAYTALVVLSYLSRKYRAKR